MVINKRKNLVFIGVILSIALLFAFGSPDIYKEISHSVRLYNEVYRQLFTNYVDPIKTREFTENSIRQMVKELDPYTVFLTEEEKEPLETLTKGKYGGVGLRISMRKDTLTVIAPMDGSPASRANILPGDQILKVDSVSTIGMDLDKSAKMIRGKIGSSVTLTIRRPGVPGVNEYTLIRENINVTDVSYAGMLENHIGYIRLSGFSKDASEEVAEAIESLRKEDRRMKGLILDLRGNPGGLLTEALAVSELFTNIGDTLLLTRGRTSMANKVFVASQKPVLPDEIKLAVLINQGSASASEIVAGVTQDLDRGIVLGAPSFGKGLVQTVFRIDREHAMKITTAKYYIPSGRLIQKPDYLNNPTLVEQTSPGDTLFYSRNRRLLRGGGGIVPDLEVKGESLSDYTRELWRQNMFYSYAIHYKSVHGEIRTPVVVSDEIISDFRGFLEADKFAYIQKNEKRLREVERELQKDDHFKDLTNPFQSVYAIYDSLKQREFEQNLDQIRRGLKSELATLAGGLSERIKNDLDSDPVVTKAMEVLQDGTEYRMTLGFAK
ncbi:MAG: S41 family peptidase [Fidelibacterota bacterium]